MSSLAQQLSQLKIQQKDQIQLPSRARISFLFDIKQAANVDDQTCFYICQSGLNQLQEQGVVDLSAFQSDIFSQKSLEFFRGNETKETLEPIDTKIELLLKLLCPHLLEPATHKVIEYLIRIYEVHVYQKETMLMAFLPYFETVFFLKAIQLLNLENDQVWGWLHQFAFTGTSIDKKTLITCLARNSGLVFIKYAEFCLGLLEHHQESNLHWKFFGNMLIEVFKEKPSDETLMFNILPFISTSLKQRTVRELKVAALLTIGQICCRKSLSTEYAAAFVRQILQTICATEFDEELQSKGLSVLLFICTYQQSVFTQFSSKDMQLLTSIHELPKVLTQMAGQFDTSSLARVFLATFLAGDYSSPLIKKLLSSVALNLKSTFILVKHCIEAGIAQNNPKARELLQQLKSMNKEFFNQSMIFLLKQVDPELKAKLLDFLSHGEADTQLVTKFGDKEYSILNALASTAQGTRLRALNAINKGFIKELSDNEKGLIQLTLVQQLSQPNDQETLIQLIVALQKIFEKEVADTCFEGVEYLLRCVASKEVTYGEDVTDRLVDLLVSLRVDNEQNQVLQILIAISSNKTVLASSTNPFKTFVPNPAQSLKKRVEALSATLKSQPQQGIALLLGAFTTPVAYLNYSLISQVLKQLGLATQKDLLEETFAKDLYQPILKKMNQEKSEFPNAFEVLSSLIDVVTDEKLVRKLFGITLKQKQLSQGRLDLASLHKKLYERVFAGSKQRFCEFLIKMAVESSCDLKKIFAIMSLCQMQKNDGHMDLKRVQIDHKIMVGVVLMLLQDPSKHVREHAIRLAEVTTNVQGEKLEVIEVFEQTEKPITPDKKPSKLTPMKSKTVASLLEDLLRLKQEVIADPSQLSTALNKHKRPEVFEEILRTILDLPSFAMKQRLLQVLGCVKQHHMTFAMNLSQNLARLFTQINQHTEKNSSQLLETLGSLINQLQVYCESFDVKKDITKSLVLPYLRYILDKAPEDQAGILRPVLLRLFDENVLQAQILTKVEQITLKEIFKLYVKAQRKVFKLSSTGSLKGLFIERASQGSFKGEDLAKVLETTTSDWQKKGNLQDLDLTLETMMQVQITSTKLQQAAIETIQVLVKKLSSDTDQRQDIQFTIELAASLATQAQPSKQSKVDLTEAVKTLIVDVWAQVQEIADGVINDAEVTNTDDPFGEFMMEVDDRSVASDEDRIEIRLIPLLQVINSFFGVLTPHELKENAASSLSITSALLKSMAEYLVQIGFAKSAQGSRQQEVITLIFNLYNSLVTKTVKMESETPFFLKAVISDYLDVTVVFLNGHFKELLKEGQRALDIIVKSGISTYGSFTAAYLFSKGSQSLDQLEPDCEQIEGSGAALFLAKKILLTSFTQLESMEAFEQTMQYLHLVELHEGEQESVAAKSKQLFDNLEIEQVVQSMPVASSTKKARKLIYLALYLLTHWISSPGSFQSALSIIAGSDTPSSQIQTQLLNTYLSSNIIKEQIQSALNDSEGLETKVKRTFIRLNGKIQDFQQALNETISLHIHVEIVMKILAKDLEGQLRLKTNTLQLLLGKISSFNRGFLANSSPMIQKVFSILVTKCIELLKKYQTKIGSTEVSGFAQALLTILSRTACTKALSQALQLESLAVVQTYQKQFLTNHDQLQLQTQLIITEMSLFEVYTFSILQHFKAFFDHVISGFMKVRSEESEKQILFSDTYRFAVLKAAISIVQIFLKFMSAQQLESILTETILCSEHTDAEEISMVLETVAIEADQNNPKVTLQAVFNTYQTVVAEQIESVHLSNFSRRYFEQLLSPLIRRLAQSFVAQHVAKFTTFFKTVLALPYKVDKKGKLLSEQVESAIVDVFKGFVVKLNEEQLRPIILKITKWGIKSAKGEDINCIKATTLCQVLNGVTETLREFFVPLIGIYFEPVILKVLDFCTQALQVNNKKRPHGAIEQDSDHVERLLQTVCATIGLTFKHDSGSYIQMDTFEALCDPLADLVTVLGCTDFLAFVEKSLKPMILEVLERVNDDNMWQKLNYQLLMKTRSEAWQTRLAVMQIIEHLFDTMRERYLVILNDTIPFISELLEDEDEQVEGCAKRIVNRIEQLTGESINEYLK